MKYLEWTMYALVVAALLFFLQVTFFAKSTDEHGILDTLPAMLEYFHEDQDRLVSIVLTPTCPYCLQEDDSGGSSDMGLIWQSTP